jgi:hypothetical protein
MAACLPVCLQVGVLLQVTRAVRLRDGKFLLLATALGRFKVGKSAVLLVQHFVAGVDPCQDIRMCLVALEVHRSNSNIQKMPVSQVFRPLLPFVARITTPSLVKRPLPLVARIPAHALL